MKCNHKYVNMEDGTGDKFCVRCSKKAQQAALYMESNKININHSIEIKIDNEIDVNTLTDRISKQMRLGQNRGRM